MIKIDGTFSVVGDNYNWTLVKKEIGEVNPKTGNPTISKQEWHYPKLTDCLRKYVNESAKASNNLKGLIKGA
jgi:hypothetical protein